MKIWYQSGTALGKPEMRDYEEALQKHLNSVKRPDVEIAFRGVDAGSPHMEYNFVVMLNAAVRGGIFSKIIQAEREGYDGVAIGNFLDVGLYQAREVVDIPVLGLGETSMHVACLLGRKFSVVAFSDKQRDMHERIATSYGLKDRMAPFCAMRSGVLEMVKALKEPKKFTRQFRDAVGGTIEAGAEVIIPGSGLMDLILVKSNLHEIDGALVLPVDAVLLKVTEAMVDLSKKLGVGVSRRVLFAAPKKDVLEDSLKTFGLI